MPEKKEQKPQQQTGERKAKKKIKYSAIKKIRQSAHKKLHNLKIESGIKSLLKKLNTALLFL